MKKIAMIMSDWAMARPINLKNLFTSPRGLTGSEISFFKYAEQLQKQGNTVGIYANFEQSGVWNGISCEKISVLEEELFQDYALYDVAIAWIDPRPLRQFHKSVKRVLNQQVNDFHYCAGWQEYVDVVLSPSESHKTYLRTFNDFDGKWEVLYNGIDVAQYEPSALGPRPRKMVYASSPDRGLHWLLEAYPEIKKRVPDVTLDIFYDWEPFYLAVKDGNTETSYRLRYCREMLDRLRNHGVTHHGSASREKMRDVFKSSRILAYPCDPVSYTEGFSVTTLEAGVSGCVPVIVGSDALPEIYGQYVPTIAAPYNNNKSLYVNTVVDALIDDDYYMMWQENCSNLKDVYNWNSLGLKLSEYIR